MDDPYVKNPQAALHPGPYREGDRVSVLWGGTPVEAVIIEDRGDLGVGGKRLYRVRMRFDDISDPLETNFYPEDMTLVAKAPKSRNGRQE